MRGRIVKVAVALCGLAGAVYAADEATAPPQSDLNRTIDRSIRSTVSGCTRAAAPASPRLRPAGRVTAPPSAAFCFTCTPPACHAAA